MNASDGPIFFVHVPKTGGTSFTSLLRANAAPGQVFTEPNHILSEPYISRLARAALPPGAIIHGHPGWGACRPFRNKARFVTLLREPKRLLVSHYLHAVRCPDMPQHKAAKGLGLRDYLRTYPYNIPFQTNALYLAITDPEEEMRQALQDPDYGSAFHLDRYFVMQLRPVFTFLDEMTLAGTLETIGVFIKGLGALMRWRDAPNPPHDNEATQSQRAQIPDLLSQLDELESEPSLAPLFAIERATYAKASSLSSPSAKMPGASIINRECFKVHDSQEGEIVLGDNFVPTAPFSKRPDNVPPLSAGWWTGDQQVSRFDVKPARAPCLLILRADILHGLKPLEVMLLAGGAWLRLAAQTTEQGETVFSTVINTAPGEYHSFQLYLQWNRYPSYAPFYPAIRFTDFQLLPTSPPLMVA